MKKIYFREIKQISKNNTFIILIINLCILLLFSLFKLISYEEIDDFMIEDILAGYSSNYNSPYTIYINYLLSYIIMIFFKLLPNINWYIISILFFQLVAFTIIGKNILYFIKKKRGICIYIGLCLLFYIPLLYNVSYTSTSGLLIVSCLTEQLYIILIQKKIKLFCILCIIFSLINGVMLRSNIFLLYCIFLSIIFIYLLINKIKIKKLLFLNIMMTILISIIYLFNSYIYKSNETYNKFIEYNKYRSILQDFIHLNYTEDKDILENVGLNYNDIDLFNSFCNSDEIVFSTQNLRELCKQKIEKDSIFSLFDFNIFEILKYLLFSWFSTYIFAIIIIFFIIFSNIKNNKFSNFLILFTIIILHILFIAINKSVYRVNVVLYIFGIITLIIINSNQINLKLNKPKQYNIILFIIFLIFLTTFITLDFYYRKFNVKLAAVNAYSELFEYTNTNKDNVYISITQALQYEYLFMNSFKNDNKYLLSNVKRLGSWDDRDDRYFDFKYKYNIDSLYSSLIEKDNCYIIIHKFNEKLKSLNNTITFLNDHYTNKTIMYKEIKNINNELYIYKLYTSY